MHVVRCERPGPPEVLEYVEAPDPRAGPGQVVVTVSVAAITFVETQARAGRSPRPGGDADFPKVLGNGVAGTVVQVGEGVDPAWLGREVVTATGGSGGYAEQVAVPATELHEIPTGLDRQTAVALLADGRTALALAKAADLGPGDRVLVAAAAGGVGSLLVQVARNAEASTVVGLAGGERKLALVREVGADAAVDYREDGWSDAVRAAIGEHGVDAGFDGVGGEIGTSIMGLMADGGRYVAHGLASGSFAPVDQALVDRRRLTVIPLSSIMPRPEDVYLLVDEALTAAADGKLKPTIGQIFPLREAATAHATIEARQALGKTLLIP